jgi:hypothetical protein
MLAFPGQQEGFSMGFLDKAKAAANDLANSAQNAMNSSGATGGVNPDRLFKDLGQIAFNEHLGKPTPPGAKDQILAQLTQLEQQGRLSPQPPPGPPPPPGANAANPPPPGGYGAPPPPPSGGYTPPPPPSGGSTPPPPPPPAAEPSSAPESAESSESSEPSEPAAPPPPAPAPPPPPSGGSTPPPPPPPDWQKS